MQLGTALLLHALYIFVVLVMKHLLNLDCTLHGYTNRNRTCRVGVVLKVKCHVESVDWNGSDRQKRTPAFVLNLVTGASSHRRLGSIPYHTFPLVSMPRKVCPVLYRTSPSRRCFILSAGVKPRTKSCFGFTFPSCLYDATSRTLLWIHTRVLSDK
jgi:hypothetical protein